MDFGLAGIEGFVGLDSEQQQEARAAAAAVEAEEKKSKNNGSNSVKQQERSGPVEENCRPFKMARADDFGISSKAMQIHHGTPLLRSNFSVHDTGGSVVCGGGGGGRSQPQMLSFGSPVSDVSFLSKEVGRVVGVAELGDNRNAQNLNLPYYQPTDNSAYTRNAVVSMRNLNIFPPSPHFMAAGGGGYGGGSMSGIMHGSFTGIRGPFTPAQWIELEHQALIYKYLTAGVPVPANLLIPIRKAINPAGFSGFNAGSFPSHSYGWGSFHLGFSGSSDPEPGRCRRTDGKKWRCSKDAVPDQKYCEKHINRGRHRSRKPVEVQISQATAVAVPSGVPNNSAAAINNYNVKVAPVPTSSIVAVSPSLSSGAGGHATIPVQQQPAGPGGINILTPAEQIVGRFQDSRGLSDMLPSINLKSKDSPFSIPKQHIPFGESSNFGFVSTDSLLNPSQKSFSSPYANNAKNFTNSFMDFTGDQQTQDQHFLRHFMDNWPKDQSNRSAMIWPEELKSDWTQLSMSIPVSDFSSSSSSPYNPDRIVPSPVKLTREVLDPTQMGLGFGGVNNELNTKPGDWIPAAVPWGGNSMGGPLGEVLNNVSNGTRVGASCKSGPTSALNLMGGGGGGSSGGGGWDGSPQLGSSPTGVLQTAAFVSLSNSSSGSSPRGETKRTKEGASVCDDLLGSAHASSSSIPA